MTTPDAIRAGFAAALATIPGFLISEYVLSNGVPPWIHFYPETVAYDAAMGRGADTWEWTVQALVSFSLDQAAQALLDGLLASGGPTSIKGALEADRTLGGAVDSLRVTDSRGYHLFDLPSGAALGSAWTVEILAHG